MDQDSKICDVLGRTKPESNIATANFETLLAMPSFRNASAAEARKQLHTVIHKPSAKLGLINERHGNDRPQFQHREDVQFREFCPWGLRADCAQHAGDSVCQMLHFRRIIKPHTDLSLGDCSYLNTCHRMEQCKYVHYELDEPEVEIDIERAVPVLPVGNPLPAQWIQCDVRNFDFSVLGKFAVIMADPPWDIHMNLPYGTMTDDEMRAMPIARLQDDGFIFLWVTGRAMELGRECLAIWGYKRVDELVWVKIMQLQKLIRTGRTGHWLNHSKEHCLVGVKGDPAVHNPGINSDVLVAEVRETSRKPDEVYGLIDRLSPGTRKIEIFGRQHNARPGWTTLGNQLEGVRICDPDVLQRYNARYPA
ncbi:N6-adenosine-methyltransferase subunit mettl3 [Geranomyces variabilis]|nr:N6-adenosine-methyltransferase subunit mettl3 [Geranomyces variabilis]